MNHDNVERIELPGSILKICECLDDSNVWDRDKYQQIYGFCDSWGVKIKLELYSEHLEPVAKSVHIKNPVNKPFSINNLIRLYTLAVYHSNPFLKNLHICLFHFNISDDIKNTCMLDMERYSFRNCKTLKEIAQPYYNSYIEHCECIEEMLINNLLFIGSLMPDTIERLEIINRLETVDDKYCFPMSISWKKSLVLVKLFIFLILNCISTPVSWKKSLVLVKFSDKEMKYYHTNLRLINN
uniref:LRR containing protein n=1 Tax=Strongyloides papillosus TaxID=174720 RepID=A0A0N5BKJ9_STREA